MSGRRQQEGVFLLANCGPPSSPPLCVLPWPVEYEDMGTELGRERCTSPGDRLSGRCWISAMANGLPPAFPPRAKGETSEAGVARTFLS
jgi:hypothetical protein